MEDDARIGAEGMWDVFIGAGPTSFSLSNKYKQLVSSRFIFYVVVSTIGRRCRDDEY